MSSMGKQGQVSPSGPTGRDREKARSRLSRRACAALLAYSLCVLEGGCSTVGVHTRQRLSMDFGPPVQMRVCVMRAPGVTGQRVEQLIAAVNQEFEPYGVEVVVPWVRPWTRPGFTAKSLLDDVVRRELEAPCDRLVAFVDRAAGDFLWGLLMPEVLGGVDGATHTRGYVVATRASLNQLLQSPRESTIHEFYHLLGCSHAAALTDCYSRIELLKRQYRRGYEFFPGVRADGRLLVTREAANETVRNARPSSLSGPEQLEVVQRSERDQTSSRNGTHKSPDGY